MNLSETAIPGRLDAGSKLPPKIIKNQIKEG